MAGNRGLSKNNEMNGLDIGLKESRWNGEVLRDNGSHYHPLLSLKGRREE